MYIWEYMFGYIQMDQWCESITEKYLNHYPRTVHMPDDHVAM